MKNVFLLIITLSFSFCNPKQNNSPVGIPADTTRQEISQEAEPFAVVELFSSEGCSDCPAAEEVLNKITREAMANKTYVYPLAFHVDYWNKLGWKDVFSDSSYSNRQRKYRKALGNEVVYTPQMIVNGDIEFVGSEEHKADSVINAELKKTPSAYFTIQPNEEMTNDGKFSVDYEILKMPAQEESVTYDLCFAIVERKLITNVTHGENKGKTLQHENIVRAFTSIELKEKKGKVMMPPLYKAPTKNHSLIAFIQDRERMKIIGANLWNF